MFDNLVKRNSRNALGGQKRKVGLNGNEEGGKEVGGSI